MRLYSRLTLISFLLGLSIASSFGQLNHFESAYGYVVDSYDCKSKIQMFLVYGETNYGEMVGYFVTDNCEEERRQADQWLLKIGVRQQENVSRLKNAMEQRGYKVYRLEGVEEEQIFGILRGDYDQFGRNLKMIERKYYVLSYN